ncbi:MAG: M48 family metalloprotease, partial [Verrucomicrobia bacterium]|nr:M48 family metalloprotease [Verrucomicrobiota bacterium]
MDFFQSQDNARRKTGLLAFYFILAVVVIVAAIYLAMAFILHGATPDEAPWAQSTVIVWNPMLFLWVTGLTLAVVFSGSVYKIAQLHSGGESVARMLGGTLIPADTTQPQERKVLNVVEEMAIASGLPVPPVYLLPETGINAFAAGFASSDAVIGVTRGCIGQLSRAELQGVMGHEFSHILNGDMRLNIRLMGVLHGILVLAILGTYLMRTARFTSSRSRKGGNPLPLIGLVLMAVGYAGV